MAPAERRPLTRPGNIVINTADPAALASFWEELTGYVPRDLFDPYVGLVDPSGVGPDLTFQRVPPSELVGVGRCHLDLYVEDPVASAERASRLGARTLRRVEEGGTSWVVLADPEGNEFCFVAATGAEPRA